MEKCRFIWVVMAVILSGCTPQPPSGPEYSKITPREAGDLMSGDAVILDVRTQEEYDEGHIENAILLPDYEIGMKAEGLLTDKNQTILVYCRTGVRSERASKALLSMGYTKVYDFGGIVDWTGDIVM